MLVKWRHHRQPSRRSLGFRARFAVEHRRACEEDFCSVPLRTGDLHTRCGLGHDHDGPDAKKACGERHGLAVVAR
jgi:hypothetical protein